jgi:hypothetical protein
VTCVRRWWLTCALCGTAAVGAAQQPVAARFEREGRAGEPLSSVVPGSVAELRDARIVIIDNVEGRVRRVDFARGTVEDIGRRGSGPLEYSGPYRALPAPGDSVWIFDLRQLRYLVLDPEGRPVRAFRIEAGGERPAEASAMPAALATQMPRAVDVQRRVYSAGSGLRASAEGVTALDSMPILRIGARSDTITWLLSPGGMTVRPAARGDSGGWVAVAQGPRNPYAPGDAWAVTARGDVIVVRSAPYRFERYLADGSVRRGPIVAVPRERMTAADIAAAEDERNERRRGRGRLPPLQGYPQYRPPFLALPETVLAAPDGSVWVLRYRGATAAGPVVDVIDERGTRVRTLEFPAGFRLLGFGASGRLYVAEYDGDGFAWLHRLWMLPDARGGP